MLRLSKSEFLSSHLEPIFSSSDYYSHTPINIEIAFSQLLLPIDKQTIMLIVDTFRDANGDIFIKKEAVYSFPFGRKIPGYYTPANKIIRLLECLGSYSEPALPLLREISKGDFEPEIRAAAKKAIKKSKQKH